MEVLVDEITDRQGEHRLHRVMEDVKTVAVLSKEAQSGVLEDTLGRRGRAQRHRDKRSAGDADNAESDGGNEEIALPGKAAVEHAGADEGCCSKREDARGEFEDTLPGRGSQNRAQAAAVQEIVCTREGRRIGKVDICEVRTKGNEDNPDRENRKARSERDADEALGALDSEHEEGPDKVELLFDLKRPEVVNVEVAQVKRLVAPNCQICRVGEEVVLPA